MSFRLRNTSVVTVLIAYLSLSLASCGSEPSGSRQAPVQPQTKSDWRIAPPGDLNAFFDCLEAEGITLVAAHRGGPVENSIAGMRRVLQDVPAIMEVDVSMAGDGVLILMHDDTLDRTTTGEGPVNRRAWNYIRRLKVLGPDGMAHDSPPSLAEALAWADGRTILELDMKRGVPYETLVREVGLAGATGRVVYIAYTAEQALALHRVDPQAMISASISEPDDLQALIDMGIPADRLFGWTGTREPDTALFAELEEAGIEVLFGTLGGDDSIDARLAATGSDDFYADLASDGVDLIATDRPREAYRALEAAGLGDPDGKCGIAAAAG